MLNFVFDPLAERPSSRPASGARGRGRDKKRAFVSVRDKGANLCGTTLLAADAPQPLEGR